jgi:sulfite reductase (NADPH) flavoprotein alpha-component
LCGAFGENEVNPVPFIPESAPFTPEQRAWLNGFLAGLFSQTSIDSSPAVGANGAIPANAEPLLVLFGSQTGSAEGLARRFAKEARRRGFIPNVLALNDCEPAKLATGGKAIIISSTWGDGDPPDNAVNFWSWLSADSAPRLGNLQFAVLGLGDKNYSDFCGASKKFDTRLDALGAKRLASRFECDVDYEASAKTWMDTLWDKLGETPGQAPGPTATNGATHTNGAPISAFSRSNPFPGKLLKNVLLNKSGTAKEVRHFEISLAGSGLEYEVGDALGVVPLNCKSLVEDLLDSLKSKGTESVKVGEYSGPVSEALIRHYDITKPSQELLAVVAKAAPASELALLTAPERRDDLKKWLYGRDVIDVLSLLSDPIPVEELIPLLRKLTPRLYSISSSPKAHPGEVHLTVSALRYNHCGRTRKGVASTYLADRVGEGGLVNVFVQPSHGFKPPTNSDTAMIMVGPGTGIAPFRAFLEERAVLGAKGKNWLFFGDQKRVTDFLYDEELTSWQQTGLLTRLDLAFSRDQPEKIYVQDRMLANAAELWSWLEDGAHFYVCGDASRMAKDVDTALHKIIEITGGKSGDDARAYVAKLKSDKRYQRDVY